MKSDIRDCMNVILNQEWTINDSSKKVWEWVIEKEITAAPAFVGKLYHEAGIKIMYVGHAFNGWDELDISSCGSCEEVLDAILSQDNAFDSFVNEKSNYKHIKSKFLRLIKNILECRDESDSPTEDSWYHDSKKWQEKFVWYNLYNFAPRHGGNPERKFIKPCIEQYVEMFRLQILNYKPDIVIVCPKSGQFIPWKKTISFDEVLDFYQETTEDIIKGKGKIGETQVIVCRRPDIRGNTEEDVMNMARCISKYIDENCKSCRK